MCECATCECASVLYGDGDERRVMDQCENVATATSPARHHKTGLCAELFALHGCSCDIFFRCKENFALRPGLQLQPCKANTFSRSHLLTFL